MWNFSFNGVKLPGYKRNKTSVIAKIASTGGNEGVVCGCAKKDTWSNGDKQQN
jgi:hypothetical protein